MAKNLGGIKHPGLKMNVMVKHFGSIKPPKLIVYEMVRNLGGMKHPGSSMNVIVRNLGSIKPPG